MGKYEGNHLEDLSVHVMIILKLIEGMNLAESRNKWQAVVSAVMNLQVPNNTGNF
jgi:hypothetical protein